MLTESPLPAVIIYEIHHHYHISSRLSTSSPSAVTPVELPGGGVVLPSRLSREEVPNIKGYLERGLPLFLEEPSPPPVRNWSKPAIHNYDITMDQSLISLTTLNNQIFSCLKAIIF
jgi:hypothetical protein